jgi:colanic acid biosynthesis glycosyl transferase WcaI
MKILVVSQYFYPESFRINDVCLGLIEKGHEVTVFTGLPNYPEGSFFEGYSYQGPYHENLGKIKIIRTPLIPRGKNKSLRLILNYFSYFFCATILAPFVVRGRFDKIFVYQVSPVTVAIPALFLKFLKKAPLILWVNDLWPESLEATGTVKNKKILNLVGILVSLIYKNSNKIFITSKGFTDQILRLGGSIDQITYFPQWAEELFSRKIDPSFEDNNIPKDGFKVMFAGNIGSSQDFETIIKAAIILKEHKEIHFLILGDGLMKDWALEEVRKNKLEKTFHFLGRRPLNLMPEYYSKAQVMLMSLSSNFLFSITVPAKLQSYLASQKPIIASMDGEGANIVEEWKAGIAVKASEPKLLADAILKMSKLSPLELELMGQNALECSKKQFDRDALLNMLIRELESLKY